MVIVFFIYIMVWIYHTSYLMYGNVRTNPDLAYRSIISVSCSLLLVYFAATIPDEVMEQAFNFTSYARVNRLIFVLFTSICVSISAFLACKEKS